MAGKMNSIFDYLIGDIIEITRRTGGVDKVYKAEVIQTNFGDNGLVTYYGEESSSGAFDPKLIGVPTRFLHIVSVKKIGHNPPNTYIGIPRTPENMRHYGVG